MAILLIIETFVVVLSLALAVFSLIRTKKAIMLVEDEIRELRANGLPVNALEGITYNKKTKTLSVNGNIKADGWIASGGNNDES